MGVFEAVKSKFAWTEEFKASVTVTITKIFGRYALLPALIPKKRWGYLPGVST